MYVYLFLAIINILYNSIYTYMFTFIFYFILRNIKLLRDEKTKKLLIDQLDQKPAVFGDWNGLTKRDVRLHD
jgi:hypothetical protein